MEFLTYWQYGFIQKAFLAGTFTALTCSILGLFLVLRKMSLIGDGLAHVSFGAVALALFLGFSPLWVSLPVVTLGSYFILKLAEKTKIYGDAAIGVVSAIGIAGGVLFSSLARGFNMDLFGYLFGNILAISSVEVWVSVFLSVVVLGVIYLFYWDLFSTTFDEDYARTTGVKTEKINVVLTILTAVTVVLSIKVVGVMLVSALLILPAITSLQLASKFKTALWLAALIALLSVWCGVIFSLIFDLPSGASIIFINVALFFLSLIIKKKS